MNSIKRSCALLLAIVLALGVALQPGIGGVFAESTEQTEQIAEPTAEPSAEPATEPAAEPEGKAETNGGLPVLSFYEQLLACGSLADFDALMRAEENTAALDALTQEEWKQLLERVEEIYAAIEQPTEADALLKEELLKKLNDHIIVICPECAGEGGVHKEGCSALAPVCSCGGEDGAHTEGCPLYVPTAAVCPECGEADGHGETCSQYKAEDGGYAWAALTDTELAAWLMDPANADTVKAILSGEEEEYDALNSRIEAILNGEDTELARQLKESLSALMGMDEPEILAGPDGYIYFDLAAGNIVIGPSSYSGYIYVDGKPEVVSGTPEAGKTYYIFQSNPSAAETSPAHPKNTGYETTDDWQNRQNCRIPSYTRVAHEGQPWTEYITNNTKVKEVSVAWDTAAANFDRTSTDHYINFTSASNYTADVTIDNIWTTYTDTKVEGRTTGGIGVNLSNTGIRCENTHIYIRMKGDNRVNCVHYSSYNGKGNTIEFYDGETTAPSGSITVADFQDNWKANHWGAAIGGADNRRGG